MKKKLFLLLFLLGALMLPLMTLAQEVTITGIVANIGRIIVVVANIITVALWVVTGILFLAAQGAPEKINKAKLALFASIGGTIIVILANSGNAIINMVSNALFQGR